MNVLVFLENLEKVCFAEGDKQMIYNYTYN